ncbi:MAG: hypothetical protein ACOCPT_01155 [Halanaeroarchaeum sp.]
MGHEGDTVERLHASREIAFEEFADRVDEESAAIKRHLAAGTFDNDEVALGMEYEFYAADRSSGALRRVPRALLRSLGFEKELGLHNAELTTGIYPANGPGLSALASDVEAKLIVLQRRGEAMGIRLVSDGTWTIGPEHNSTWGYLTEATREGDIALARNVSDSVRYHGFTSGRRDLQCRVDLPGATIDAENAGPVSLTTSIQAHYQVPDADALPAYFGAALRIAGPLVALGANSPFLPPALYDDPEPDRRTLLDRGVAEKRIPVYEGMMNPTTGPTKVRFPRDLETTAEAVDRIARDSTVVPADLSTDAGFDDAFAHFRHKHGSYWRWIRPVFGGSTRASANVRIEFRPLAGQPTVPDSMAFVAAIAGLVTGLGGGDHPAARLPWETARANFYAAARDGFDAHLTWVTADGVETTDRDLVFRDLLATATEGLETLGLSRDDARSRLAPLRDRVERSITPARWKRRVVADELDAGATTSEAIHAMQRQYLDRQAATLTHGTLAAWPRP